MQNLYPSRAYFPTMRRVEQISDSHCGPASLVMLLSYLGVDVSQEAVVEHAGVWDKIPDYGMLVPELATAVKKLTPQFQFWYKENSSLDDVRQIIERFRYPVGVEWQGVFYEYSDGDDGHYSVITHVDQINGVITIADPFGAYSGGDRVFHTEEFLDRWWEENEIQDPLTGVKNILRDERMSFIVTGREVTFPEGLGMQRG